ncbi:hypothetical protein ELQ92_06290 [Labedella populi]|uniref:Beta-lactamase class A catalytic domain-containing protein n=1 Tax=Labedella populi TaxID=2498850 RepID=A0A444QCH6_9MICO|nr:serine hydrolase [Labedella populi]RWZ64375.1 hypothetical protein ELQ92_06290 [Labedella populi]
MRAAIAAVAAAVILSGLVPMDGPAVASGVSALSADVRSAGTVDPTEAPEPTDPAVPTDPQAPTDPAVPTETPGPSEPPRPEETPEPSVTPAPEDPSSPVPGGEKPSEPSDVGPAQVPPGTQAVEFQAPKPVLQGTFRDGSTVQVSAGYWTPTPTTVSFQWFADGKAIAKATSRALKIGANLVGKRLSAKVTGTREGYTSKTTTTDQSKYVMRGVTDEALLLSKLKTRLSEHGEKYTIAVRELNGAQRSVSVYGGSEREPASTSKLFIAYAALDNIDTGRLSFSTRLSSGTSVRDCLRALIEVSDNYCARDLLAHIGRTKLNTKLANEGYPGTEFRSSTNSSGWNKTSTANDLALLLSRLERGQLLSRANTSYLTGLMKQQVWRTRLASGLPAGVDSASKPGELWLSSGMVQLDVGIVYGPKSTYVLTVMGQRNATKTAIKEISKTVFLHLQGYPSSTPTVTYPAAQMKTSSRTAIKSSPGGTTTAMIAAGAKVEVINSQRAWYYVKVNGRTGWIPFTNLRSRWG